MLRLPVFPEQSADYTYTVTLDERVYRVRMVFNTRAKDWFLSITDTQGTGQIDGVRVVPNYPLFYTHRAQIQFRGDLFCLPRANNAGPIDYLGIGTTYDLVYMNPAELNAWRTANGLG